MFKTFPQKPSYSVVLLVVLLLLVLLLLQVVCFNNVAGRAVNLSSMFLFAQRLLHIQQRYPRYPLPETCS